MEPTSLELAACGVTRTGATATAIARDPTRLFYFDFLTVARCAFHSKRHIGNIAAQTAAILTTRETNKKKRWAVQQMGQ